MTPEEVQATIREDQAVARRCFPHGTTPLNAQDWVRPYGIDPTTREVVLKDIDGGHRSYRVKPDAYAELRKTPWRHVGIWSFVREDDPAMVTVTWAINNAEAAGRQLYEAKERISQLEVLVDPAVCRLQFPDGSVPGNAKEAAEGRKKLYDELRPLKKRPVAWRVATPGGRWVYFDDEGLAVQYCDTDTKAIMQGLYAKDGAQAICPVCGGDCAGANPPVTSCPMKR